MAKKAAINQTFRLKNYINGEWQESISKLSFKSLNPANIKDLVAIATRSSRIDVDKAIVAAKRTFSEWKQLPAPERANILLRVVKLIEEQKEEVADLIVREMGKIKTEALTEVQIAIDLGYYFIGEGRRLHGQTIATSSNEKDVKIVREPVGVFSVITPWNFPIQIPILKIFPALVCGNCVVFKPSQNTPACGTKLVKLFEEAGIPKGVINLVLGFGSEIGNVLVEHRDINGVSFTGSTAVGKYIGQLCGTNFKKHSLEMGGKNAMIIMDDVNIDFVVNNALYACFATSGQRCSATSRIIIHEKIYDTFRKKFALAAKKLKIAPGNTKDAEVGPLVSDDALKKVHEYVRIGRNEDRVRMLCGGDIYSTTGCKQGYFYQPTIFNNVKPDMRVAQEEIFGPVVCLMIAKNLREAIKIANSTKYGLSASIYTNNIRNAHFAARELKVGLVYINSPTNFSEIGAPFGGVGQSGNGKREAGGLGGSIDVFTELKVVTTDFSGKAQKKLG